MSVLFESCRTDPGSAARSQRSWWTPCSQHPQADCDSTLAWAHISMSAQWCGGVEAARDELEYRDKDDSIRWPLPPSSSHIFKEDKSKHRSAGSWAQGRENQKTLNRIIKTRLQQKENRSVYSPLRMFLLLCSLFNQQHSRFTFSWRKTAAQTWESVKQKSMKASSAVKHLRSDFHQINQVLQEEKIQTKQNQETESQYVNFNLLML